jgi:hypothetical protein
MEVVRLNSRLSLAFLIFFEIPSSTPGNVISFRSFGRLLSAVDCSLYLV